MIRDFLIIGIWKPLRRVDERQKQTLPTRRTRVHIRLLMAQMHDSERY